MSEQEAILFFKQVLTSKVSLSAESLDYILEHAAFRQVHKYDYLLEEGQVCRELYFVCKGMLRTFLLHDGLEVTTWVAIAGLFDTSAHSFLKQKPSAVNIQSISDSDLLVISYDMYRRLLTDIPEGKELVLTITQQYYLQLEEMFYSCISLSALERYQKMLEQYPDHFRQVPLKYLASMLRVRQATLSRIRRKMALHN